MMQNEGFWYSVGRGCYKLFHLLEWTYDHVSPNKILIVVGFLAFGYWIKLQNDYNKKAEREGGLK